MVENSYERFWMKGLSVENWQSKFSVLHCCMIKLIALLHDQTYYQHTLQLVYKDHLLDQDQLAQTTRTII